MPELYVNAREINQMFMALLRRAFESLPRHTGGVTVSARLEADAVLVEVSDNGAGMDGPTQRALFDVTLRNESGRVAADSVRSPETRAAKH